MNNIIPRKKSIIKRSSGNILENITGICLLLLFAVFARAQSVLYHEIYWPQFHFSTQSLWINNPCGTVYYNGEYHLIYQYNESNNTWGPISWGQAVLKDLVHWENFPVALSPDSKGRIWSGSDVVDSNNTAGLNTNGKKTLVAIYTLENGIQQPCHAYSLDSGRVWSKYTGNPVLLFGIHELSVARLFNVYPNPAKESFFVKTEQFNLGDFTLISIAGFSIPIEVSHQIKLTTRAYILRFRIGLSHSSQLAFIQ